MRTRYVIVHYITNLCRPTFKHQELRLKPHGSADTQLIAQLLDHPQLKPASIFQIGHSGGVLSQYFSKQHHVLVAEIDKKVFEVSQTYFDYPYDNVIIGDGRAILSLQDNQSFNAILIDAFSSGTIPFHLVTDEFYQLAKEKTSENGIVIAHFTLRPDHPLLGSIAHTMKQHFNQVVIYMNTFEKEHFTNYDHVNPSIIMVGTKKGNAPTSKDVLPDSISTITLNESTTIVRDSETKFIEIR